MRLALPWTGHKQPPIILSDGVVALRPWRSADAAALQAAAQDPEVARRIPIAQPFTLAEARAFIESAARSKGKADGTFFAITDAKSGALLGSLSRYISMGRVASFGYWLGRNARGRGAATRALRLASDWTLATADVDRLEVQVVVGNDSSIRVAERAGYSRTAFLPAHYTERGVRQDCVLLVRRRAENSWPPVNR